LILRVVHKQTAASSSTSPVRTGQHWFTTGSPRPMCTSPPRRSTQAPSFSVSIGHVSLGDGGGGHGFPFGGFVVTGGTVIGGTVTGGSVTGGSVTGGFTIGGTGSGGRVTGGFTIGGTGSGGSVIGALGVLGCLFFGCLPQEPQSRVGAAEEMKIMQRKRKAEILVESMFTLPYFVLEREREMQSEW